MRTGVGISADGSTVVGSGFTTAGPEAIRWVNGGSPQGLGFMAGGTQSYAVGTSADGSVIVGRGDALQGPGDPYPGNTSTQGFRWTEADGMQSLGYLPYGGYYEIATGVSADGSVVTGYSDGSGGTMAYRWTQAAGLEGIGTLSGNGSHSSQAAAISGDGLVIVGESNGAVGDSLGAQAFRWTETSGITGLIPLPGSNTTRAHGVSADGSVIVGNSYTSSCIECEPSVLGRNNAVRWTDQGPATLLGQVPGGDQGSNALGVSADGSVIVGLYQVNANDPLRGFRAFVWTADGGMQKLLDVLLTQGATGLSGWTLLQATGVSADGRTIAGYGLNPAGEAQAFVTTLNVVPVPPAAWLFGSALGLIGVIRRKVKT
ncbi:MAG: PEP-CTERM sorting domain-containing protein [Gammaproteobacteria bacterium]